MTNYGIQLFSLRDVSKTDLKGTLEKVANMGYKSVEFAGFFGNKAEYVKAWLFEYGLKVIGTHTKWQELDTNFASTVEYHHIIGCTDIIIPGAPLSNSEDLENMITKINKWQPILKEEGIRLHFHNHAGEFLPTEEGYIPEYELKAHTDIGFEIDTYWAYVAGRNPVDLLDEFGDRVKFIHLKDGDPSGKGKSLGLGNAPVKAVLKKATETGKGIIVESEGLDPSGEEEVARCMEFLKTIG